MEKASYKYEVIHETLTSSPGVFNISVLCEMAGVSRSGYYAWKKAAPAREEREAQDRADFELILTVYKKRGYAKGARSIYMGLLHLSPPVIMNIKKIRRLMKKYSLFCPIRKANPYRRMAKALKTSNYADNILQREFECYGPRYVLLTDITYIPYNGTFAYLSTILDAYTKQILAYVVSDSLEVAFVKETVEILVRDHGISLHKETLIHSDQGSHYTSVTFIQIVEDADLQRSMSRRGNCWDNAPQESFFGHMKDHIKDRIRDCTEFQQVKSVIDDYMDYYNNEEYVWDLYMLSPNEFYQFVTTGIYPLSIDNPPQVPEIQKSPEELRKREEGKQGKANVPIDNEDNL
jgi:transposase InsO family protein